ncbi:hypothetical protein C0J52_18607 [Blattella germanica]|nr:hypothetical protein C0J52_18607 [Blattella germanica]
MVNILPLHSRSAYRSFSFWFPFKDPPNTPSISHPCHMSYPSKSMRFIFSYYIWFPIKIL